MKATLVMGASENPSRYANIAANRLTQHHHPVILFGKQKGTVGGNPIHTEWDENWKVDTVTLYLSRQNQVMYYEKIINLKPERVIFNPGTENSEFVRLLKENGIKTEDACTLVMLSLGQY